MPKGATRLILAELGPQYRNCHQGYSEGSAPITRDTWSPRTDGELGTSAYTPGRTKSEGAGRGPAAAERVSGSGCGK